MVIHVERDAGYAAFRHRRSLYIRLVGTLDGAMSRGVSEQLQWDHLAVRLRIECTALDAIEALAAARMAGAVLGWTSRAHGRTVDVLDLKAALQRELPCHRYAAVT